VSAWRDSVYTVAVNYEVPMVRSDFDDAAATIDRLLKAQVAGLVAGDSAAFAQRIPEDRVLQEALARLQSAPTVKTLLGLN
jgi:hypothetical protein